jgi:hypothetical protein
MAEEERHPRRGKCVGGRKGIGGTNGVQGGQGR